MQSSHGVVLLAQWQCCFLAGEEAYDYITADQIRSEFYYEKRKKVSGRMCFAQ
jgi:hypothetical protein